MQISIDGGLSMSYNFIEKFNPFNQSLTEKELFSFRNDLILFFQGKITDNINNWDIIVKIDRKGILIFDDLSKNSPISDKIIQIPSFDVSSYGDEQGFENKRVLLFDDSIRTGQQIRTEIEIINEYNIKSLSIATIMAKNETFENLERDYKNINFIIFKILNKDDFFSIFTKYMTKYFDYICMPQTKDLKVVKYTLPFRFSSDRIMQLFETEHSKVELEKTEIKFEDRYKMVLDFSDEEIADITESVIPTHINLKIDTCKIRFFVHILEIKTEIYIEYIINPIGDFFKCNGGFKHCFKENQEDSDICLVCSIFNLTNFVEGSIKKNLIAHNKFYEYYELPWTLILNIKDHK